jgi:hypothetical protein
MAIRDDFTAGEVLAAADLNDTFGAKIPYAYGTATPSTTVDGFVWYDENSTPPAPKFWDGAAFQPVSAPSGLVHVATESFSAVSSVSLNGVFTSAYDNYKVFVRLSRSGSNITINLRYRAAGTDTTSSDYFWQRLFGSGATAGASSETSATLLNVFGDNNTDETMAVMEISSPALAARTMSFTQVNYADGGVVMSIVGSLRLTNAYDGFTLIPSSGTITGTLRVYGYQNS